LHRVVCDQERIYIAGSTVCTSCDAGKYKAAAGVNTACDACVAGKYKTVAGVNLDCDNCVAGKFSAAVGATVASTCATCTAGKVSSGTLDGIWPRGSTVCYSCYWPGTFSDAGASVCADCAAGKYTLANSGSSVCFKCDAGKYLTTTGCVECGAGKYKAAAGINTACDECGAGKSAAAGASVCTACGAGKYSVAGSGATVCTDCDAGKFQATAEASTCSGFLCAVGKYSQPGATSSAAAACTDCREGTYSEKEGSTVCASCKAGKYSTAVGATACSDCGAGKSSASSSTVCADCGTGTYSDVSGSTACLECTKKPCPFGTFELSNCTRQADKVCQVYVHNVPTIGKIVIACGQVPFVVLTCFVVVFKISKLRSGMGVGANGKWAVFSLFVIGIYDVVSDFTTLALIPMKNPFFLFHVSLASLGCSVAASLVLSFYSSINLSWPTRAFIFITGTAGDFGKDWPEKWNSRVLLCVENLPQLAVQAILLYLQRSQGFTGWDWAILVQTLLFTLLNIVIRIRKLGKDLRGKREEVIEQGSGVASAVMMTAVAV